MSMMIHAVSWFEIPVSDLKRAKTFYETIFGIELVDLSIQEVDMAMFPTEPGTIGGALCFNAEFYIPSTTGTTVYLNANPDLQVVLDRIEKAGGKILVPKTRITEEYGYMAVFLDTEGNKAALHSLE